MLIYFLAYFFLECSNGDVRLGDNNIENGHDIPLIFWNGNWWHICGHHFWDNSEGVNAFCRKLGYYSGSINPRQSGRKSRENAFWIGKCERGDIFPTCTGKCNKKTLGGVCKERSILGILPIPGGSNCDAGEHIIASVNCFGPSGVSSSC